MDDKQQQGRPQQEREPYFEDSFLGQVFAQASKRYHDASFVKSSHGERSTFENPVQSSLHTVFSSSRSVVPSAIGLPVEAEPASTINEIPVVDLLGCGGHHLTTQQHQQEQGKIFATADPSHKRKKMIGTMTVVLLAAITGAIAGSVSSHKSGKVNGTSLW